MSLRAGTRLGPYEIQSPLGAGGMGEVYKALDTRLDRIVAIKILPEALAGDPQFRERFEREARTISQLDHAHICALYDVGVEQGTSFLVMQYLEGETLAARIQKGALAVSEAVKLGIEIAGALDKAHRAGVVHRDLKPGNIMLTKSGAKLLDFGLAKNGVVSHGSPSFAPTTPVSITAQGTILGTFQYMAPEQVEGQEADARSDLFAFGAVLFEMVTGRPAFQGKTQASLIGSILRDDPTLTPELTPSIPPALGRVIRTCLSKNPDDRFQTAHDVGLQLQWILDGGSQAGVPIPVPAAAPKRGRAWLPWGVAGAAIVAAAALAAAMLMRKEPPARTVRFDVPTPETVVAIDAPRLSPDGRYLAFNAIDSTGKTRVWIRQLNSLTAQPLPGTEGTTRPFWSPDSRFVAFMADGKLKKVDVGGGPAQKIADAPTGSDGSWGSQGVILFDGRNTDPIYRVSAAGGTPAVAVKPDASRKENGAAWPEFLPDGRHFLYLAMSEKPEDYAYRIGTIDSTDTQPLMSGQTQMAFAPPNYLLFARDQTLVAQPFDTKTLKTTGEPVPLAERIGTNSIGQASFSVSRDGTLAYRTGDAGSQLIFATRDGKEIGPVGDVGDLANPAISRDGGRVAYANRDRRSAKIDLWIRDLARGVSSRFTFGAGDNGSPIWSPDGSRIVFTGSRGVSVDLFEKVASGQGDETLLLKSDQNKIPSDWSSDGRYIAYHTRNPKTDWDLWVLPTFGDRKPIPVVVTPAVETNLVFSPDSRFVAYRSTESGTNQIYVQTFPNATGKWQVSDAGGSDPSWRADGKELYYRSTDQRIMSVEIRSAPDFQASVPRPLFVPRMQTSGTVRNRYAVTADGQRFLLVAPPGRDAMVPTTVVLNWSAELGR